MSSIICIFFAYSIFRESCFALDFIRLKCQKELMKHAVVSSKRESHLSERRESEAGRLVVAARERRRHEPESATNRERDICRAMKTHYSGLYAHTLMKSHLSVERERAR